MYRFSEEETQKLKMDILNGATWKDLLLANPHISIFLFRRFCKSNGLPLPNQSKRGKKPQIAKKLLCVKLKEQGLTYREIGKQLGLTHQAIQQHIMPQQRSGMNPNDVCKICGTSQNLSRHHFDYGVDKVVVLCKSCHRKEHCEITKIGMRERYKDSKDGSLNPDSLMCSLKISQGTHSKLSFAAALTGDSIQNCVEVAISEWYDRKQLELSKASEGLLNGKKAVRK